MSDKAYKERKFVRYEVEGIKEITDIWAFIMSHVDDFKSLNVEVNSVLGYWDDEGVEDLTSSEDIEPTIRYQAAVFGDIEGGW